MRVQRWSRLAHLRSVRSPRRILPPTTKIVDNTHPRTFTSQRSARQELTQVSASAQDAEIISQKGWEGVSTPKALPIACPGCGAPSHHINVNEPGFYSLDRRAVQYYFQDPKLGKRRTKEKQEHELFSRVVKQASEGGTELEIPLDELGKLVNNASRDAQADAERVPLCDRCHELLHHSQGTPIAHPSLQSIRDTIAESPYKYNHIYHVIDAADFPLSLISGIQRFLELAPQRSRNRRAHHAGFKKGGKSELSFVITRSDLLAPTKEQVDKLLPWIIRVLRAALGSRAEDVRMGNVRCVSAKRGWWLREVRTDVWKRGGGGWMIGKVNVGKSKLYENIYPKGNGSSVDWNKLRREAATKPADFLDAEARRPGSYEFALQQAQPDEFSLLPEARKETPFPLMPTVSALPGTTASPIRIPFGNGRGELIDMPGLLRTPLDGFLKSEHRNALLMNKRVIPEQYNIAPGKSLILGGLVRISNPGDTMVLAYPFLPAEVQVHLTSIEKAEAMMKGQRDRVIPYIITEEAQAQMAMAGRYYLGTDVTRRRAGPLLSALAGQHKVHEMPFQALSTDLLIESLGWVELVCEVRRPRRDGFAEGEQPPSTEPHVEVYSPQGRLIGQREPLQAFSILSDNPLKPKKSKRGRPRPSMTRARKSKLGSSKNVQGVQPPPSKRKTLVPKLPLGS